MLTVFRFRSCYEHITGVLTYEYSVNHDDFGLNTNIILPYNVVGSKVDSPSNANHTNKMCDTLRNHMCVNSIEL